MRPAFFMQLDEKGRGRCAVPPPLPQDGGRRLLAPNIISQSIGGTGVSPVQALAKACGYCKLLFDCHWVLRTKNGA